MTLRFEDEQDLNTYFAEVGRAQRSIQGPILEKMMLMSVKRKKSTEPITARPTAETRTIHAVEPDVAGHALLGRVSRKLKLLSAKNAGILEVFYGDEGACCAEHHGLARVVALYRLTKAGMSIAKAERKSAGSLKLSTMEHIQNAVVRSKAQGGSDADLLNMVSQAHARAVEIQAQAERAYTLVGDEVDAQRPKPERAKYLRLVGSGPT